MARRAEQLAHNRWHAPIVAWLSRHKPYMWRLLYRHPVYVFDSRDRQAGADLADQASELRLRFEQEKDIEAMLEILERLASIDRRAARMSIGTDHGNFISYGEAILPGDVVRLD